MTELEDQLTGMLHQKADNVRVEDRLDDITNRTSTVSPTSTRRQQRHRIVFAAAAVLLVVAGAIAVRQVGDTPRSAPSATDTTSATPGSTTSTAEPATTVTSAVITAAPTTLVEDAATDCLPTFRFDDVHIDPPEGVSGRDLVFAAEIVYPDGAPFLQATVLEAPEGTAIIEVIVNGRSRGGSSYGPDSVHGVPLRDESTAIVELCAYGSDNELITSKRSDEVLIVE